MVSVRRGVTADSCSWYFSRTWYHSHCECNFFYTTITLLLYYYYIPIILPILLLYYYCTTIVLLLYYQYYFYTTITLLLYYYYTTIILLLYYFYTTIVLPLYYYYFGSWYCSDCQYYYYDESHLTYSRISLRSGCMYVCMYVPYTLCMYVPYTLTWNTEGFHSNQEGYQSGQGWASSSLPTPVFLVFF